MFEYSPRQFQLESVEGLSLRAIHLHLELYKGYVQNVNRLLAAKLETQESGAATYERVRRLGFEWNGMVLHELFFEALRGPGRRIDGKGVFAEALDESFGGFEAWKNDLTALAAARGIGWVAAVRDPATNCLFNAWIDEHHLGMPAGVQTLLVIDLWEHAWILDYPPAERGRYVETVLRNVDWSIVDARAGAEGVIVPAEALPARPVIHRA
jgi:Fe-Mn family superoxide dismutase